MQTTHSKHTQAVRYCLFASSRNTGHRLFSRSLHNKLLSRQIGKPFLHVPKPFGAPHSRQIGFLVRFAGRLLKLRYVVLGGTLGGGYTASKKYEEFKESLPDTSWLHDYLPKQEHIDKFKEMKNALKEQVAQIKLPELEWVDEKKLEDLPSSELVFDLMDQSNPDMGDMPDPGSLSVEIANLKDYLGIGDKSLRQYLGIEDKSFKEILGIPDKPLLGTEDLSTTITIENPSPKESVDIPPAIQAENINEISEHKELLELSAEASSDFPTDTPSDSHEEPSDREMACEEGENPSENDPTNDYLGRSTSFKSHVFKKKSVQNA